MDAPRNSDGQHAPETPKTNTRTPASIFHFNSTWATPALRPISRSNATPLQRHDDANQCCAVYGWHREKDSANFVHVFFISAAKQLQQPTVCAPCATPVPVLPVRDFD